jgi:hypothetical protein
MKFPGSRRSSGGLPATLIAAVALASGWGCQKNSKLRADTPPASAVAPGDAAAGIDVNAPTAVDTAEAVCAEESHATGLTPVDIVLLIDRGYSTDTPLTKPSVDGGAPERIENNLTRWVLLREVLLDFLRDPRSAGMNVGLQFMPWVGEKTVCTTDEDCPGGMSRSGVLNCLQDKVCTGGLPWGCFANSGAVTADGCVAGERCITGQCSFTGHDCFDVGKPCPTKAANDMCLPRKRLCRGSSISCDYEKYDKLAVDFSPLPAQTAPLVERLLQTAPSGLPNIGPAVDHSLKVLKARLADPANANHRAALVLITDNLPSVTCLPPSATLTGDLMAEALANKPSIRSYVLGVIGDEAKNPKIVPGWTEMAQKGGTTAPFIVKPDADFLTKFQSTLDEIRGLALPCEFAIPAMTSGPIDYGKVNLHWKGEAGEQEVPYVASAQRCDANKGGWYYDVDPAAEVGATPSRVVACPTTCQRFKADSKASVDLRYGCKTRGID